MLLAGKGTRSQTKILCSRVSIRKRVLSRVWLCSPLGGSPPGSSVHGISQARTLEWVATSSSRASSQYKDWIHVSHIGRQVLCHWASWEAHLRGKKKSELFFLSTGVYKETGKDNLSLSTCASCGSCIAGGFFATKSLGKPRFQV